MKRPVPQRWHQLDAANTGPHRVRLCPAAQNGQSRHCSCPMPGWYLPRGHWEQPEPLLVGARRARREGMCMPAGQSWQSLTFEACGCRMSAERVFQNVRRSASFA